MTNDRKLLADRIALAADWYVRSQVRMEKPYWDANHGRFVYDRHRPSGTTVWGLNWTQARGIMVLIAADRLAPKDEYLATARLAAEYLEILQILDARRPTDFGAIREEVPQSKHYNIRDQAEAASGLLYLGAYLGEERLIDSARLWAEWYLKHVVHTETGWPRAFREPDGSWRQENIYFLAANGLVMYHLGARLGVKRYIDDGLVRNAEYALAHLFDARGALHVDPYYRMHAGAGGLVLNEDGATIALMAAERVTGLRSFKDAALRHLDLVMAEPTPLPLYAGRCNTMMVAAEAARIYDYAPARQYIERNLPPLLDQQITDPHDKNCGAFIGEDEDQTWYSGGVASDYVTTRCTAYGVLALAKIEGTAVTGGYSTDAALPARQVH